MRDTLDPWSNFDAKAPNLTAGGNFEADGYHDSPPPQKKPQRLPDEGVPSVVPSDPQAEATMLALVISDNAQIDRVADLEIEDFFEPLNRMLWETALALRAEGRPINLVTLKAKQYAMRLGDGRDVIDYIKGVSLAGEIPDALDLAKLLRELATRRKVLAAAQSLMEMAQNYATPPTTMLAEGVRQLDDVAARLKPAGRTVWSLSEAVDAYLSVVSSGEVPETISSGLPDLDVVTGAFRPGEYWLLAGRPSAGKSTLALALALGAARSKRSVLKFSLEMTASQLAARAVSEAAYRMGHTIPYTEASAGKLDLATSENLVRAGWSMRDLKLTIDETAGLTVSEIAARVRKAKAADPTLGLVIVDHLGKVRPSGRYKGDRVNEVTEISGALAEIAKNERVCMLALSQLNRKVEERDNKRPGLSDLRDSGSLEQDADVVMFVYRPAYYLERTKFDEGSENEMMRLAQLQQVKNLLEVGIAKNRNGRTGAVELYIDLATNYIAGLGDKHG